MMENGQTNNVVTMWELDLSNKYLNINYYTYYLNSASQYALKQYARSIEVISLIIRSNSCKTSKAFHLAQTMQSR